MEKERTCLFSRTFAGEAAALLPDIDFLAPMYYHSHQSNTIPEDFRSLSAALRLRVLGSVNLEKYVIKGGCRLTGEVKFILYKGNHYHLTVFTDWDEDIFVDTNDVWDDGDRVGITIAPENIRIVQSTKKEGSDK